MRLQTTREFERGLRRSIRRRKDPEKLWAIVERLWEELPLESYNRLHRLTGNWAGFWECHIEPNWLLIWASMMMSYSLSVQGLMQTCLSDDVDRRQA